MENDNHTANSDPDVKPETSENTEPVEQDAPAITIPDDAIIIIPVRNVVLFPGLVVPLSIGRKSSVAAAQEAVRSGRQVGVLLQKQNNANDPTPDQLFTIGTVASILRYVTVPDGSHHIICQGEQRCRVKKILSGYPFPVAIIERLEEEKTANLNIEALMVQLKTRSAEILQMLPQAPTELIATTQNITSPSILTDFIAGVMDLKLEEKQDVLETIGLETRMEKVLKFLVHNIEVLRVSHDIEQQTKERFEDRQREVLLREQLKTIQKQLGETDSNEAEIAEIEQKIERAKVPEEIETQLRKELKRLQHMSDASAEYSMLRTYMDWVTELPWSVTTDDRIDIAEARTILDQDHYGLDKIKRRILEYLAVQKLNPKGKSPILCFVGLRGWVKHRWAKALPGPQGASLHALAWAGSTTKQKYAVIGAPI